MRDLSVYQLCCIIFSAGSVAAAGAEQGVQHGGSGLMQGGSRLLHLLLGRHTEGRRLGGVCRGFFTAVCRNLGGSAVLTGGVTLGGLAVSGASSAGTSLSAGSSAIALSGDYSGMDAPALGSAVGVKTSVFSGVWLVLVSLSSPPRTAAMRALASLTEFSSGFMT